MSRFTFCLQHDTFQLVLATDGLSSFVIQNYRIGSMTAQHSLVSPELLPRVGMASTNGFAFTLQLDEPTRPDLVVNNVTGWLTVMNFEMEYTITILNSHHLICFI